MDLIRFYLLLFFLSSHVLYAQLTPFLVTGRPSNTAGPYTVDPGMWHIEAGVSIESQQRLDQPLRFYNLSVPGIDIRTGLSQDAEINLSIVEKLDFLGGFQGGGIGPINLGLKFNIYKSKNWLPTISLSSKIALPIGSKELRPEYITPSLKLVFAHFFDKSVIMYNLGAFWQETPRIRGNYTLMHAYAFKENLSAYAEIYGGFIKLENLKGNLAIGIAYAPHSNWQIDLSGGLDLQEDLKSRYLAIGYSLRFFTKTKDDTR